jgi:hypothetical protein
MEPAQTMRRTLIGVGIALSALALVYCLMGAITVMWVSATPGDHDLNVLKTRAYAWLGGAGISLLIGTYLLYVARKRR